MTTRTLRRTYDPGRILRSLDTPVVRHDGINLSRPKGITGYQAEAIKDAQKEQTRRRQEAERQAQQAAQEQAKQREQAAKKLAEEVLSRARSRNGKPSLALVHDVVVDYYHLQVTDLSGERRGERIAHYRQVAFYLSVTQTQASQPQIAAFYGKGDHTTVNYGARKIAMLVGDTRFKHPTGIKVIAVNPKVAAEMAELVSILQARVQGEQAASPKRATIEVVVAAVAKAYGKDPQVLYFERSPRTRVVRNLALYLGSRLAKESFEILGGLFNLSADSVQREVRAVAKMVGDSECYRGTDWEIDPELKLRVDQIEQHIALTMQNRPEA